MTLRLESVICSYFLRCYFKQTDPGLAAPTLPNRFRNHDRELEFSENEQVGTDVLF
jgi:hypothetical protein